MKGEIMQETTDIFLWANNVDAQKRELNVEFFLFNKNYTPYTVRIGSMAYDSLINSLFLDDILNEVSFGAGEGITVRDITYTGEDKNFLPRVPFSATDILKCSGFSSIYFKMFFVPRTA